MATHLLVYNSYVFPIQACSSDTDRKWSSSYWTAWRKQILFLELLKCHSEIVWGGAFLHVSLHCILYNTALANVPKHLPERNNSFLLSCSPMSIEMIATIISWENILSCSTSHYFVQYFPHPYSHHSGFTLHACNPANSELEICAWRIEKQLDPQPFYLFGIKQPTAKSALPRQPQVAVKSRMKESHISWDLWR